MFAIIGARPHRRFALFVVVLASLLADGAVADPYDALPKTVIADVKALETSCVDDGGTPTWKADEFVKTVDLSLLWVSVGRGRWSKAFDDDAFL